MIIDPCFRRPRKFTKPFGVLPGAPNSGNVQPMAVYSVPTCVIYSGSATAARVNLLPRVIVDPPGHRGIYAEGFPGSRM